MRAVLPSPERLMAMANSAPVLPITLRDPTAEDVGVILKSWLKSHRGQDGCARMSAEVYYAIHRPRVMALLERSTVIMAVNPDDTWHVYGWICFEPGTAHYVYVKHTFRRMGVAGRLWDAAGRPKTASSTGPLWGELQARWGVVYDPRSGGSALSMLGNLLAVLHRDGGHRVQSVGLEKAYEEAMRIASEAVVR